MVSDTEDEYHMIVDGEPYFPIGWYCSDELLFWDEAAHFMDGMFNATICQSHSWPEWMLRNYLDYADEIGVKSFLQLPEHFSVIDRAFEYPDPSWTPSGRGWNIIGGSGTVERVFDTGIPDLIYMPSAEENWVLQIVSQDGLDFILENDHGDISRNNFCIWIKPGSDFIITFTVNNGGSPVDIRYISHFDNPGNSATSPNRTRGDSGPSHLTTDIDIFVTRDEWNFIERNIEEDFGGTLDEFQKVRIEGGNYRFDFLSYNNYKSIDEGEESYYQRIVDFVNGIKDHNALLGWYPPEEPEWRGYYQAFEEVIYDWIVALDDSHPVFLLGPWEEDNLSSSFFEDYSACYDISGTDIYPTRFDGDTGDPENEEFSVENDYERIPAAVIKGMDVVRAENKIAMMFIPQAFDHTWSDVAPHNGYFRLPTFLEQRYMAYSTIIHGARGLIWFKYPYAAYPEQPGGEPGQEPPYDPDYINYTLVPLVDELEPLLPIIMNGSLSGVTREDTVATNDYPDIITSDINDILLQAGDGHYYLLAVNDSRTTRESGGDLSPVTFTIPEEIPSDTVVVIGEDVEIGIDRPPIAENNELPVTFTDSFDIYDVNLYYFRQANDPVLPYIEDTSVHVYMDNVQIEVCAIDPDNPDLQLNYSCSPLPEGARFERSVLTRGNGGLNELGGASADRRTFAIGPYLFYWDPAEDQVGTYDITFRVEDPDGGCDWETVQIEVKDQNPVKGGIQ